MDDMKDDERQDMGEEALEGQLQELPGEEIARLRSELDDKVKEADRNHNMYLRACADLENYKKRAERERADAVNFANEALIEEVLPVIDNFERALSHANGENVDSLRKGVHLTADQMYSVLKKFGLQEIKSVGEKFDPSLHHAITEEETEGAAPGTVVKEFQKGYLLKGRLLRPAMVAVSKAAGPGRGGDA